MSTPTPPTIYRQDVAANVRAELGRADKTGAALSRMIHRDPSYVSRRLKGEYPWDVDDLARISLALEIDVETLTKVRA